MTNVSLARLFLEENARLRRDTPASYEQEEEVRQAAVAFRYQRVLLSRARLRAESYLQRN